MLVKRDNKQGSLKAEGRAGAEDPRRGRVPGVVPNGQEAVSQEWGE